MGNVQGANHWFETLRIFKLAPKANLKLASFQLSISWSFEESLSRFCYKQHIPSYLPTGTRIGNLRHAISTLKWIILMSYLLSTFTNLMPYLPCPQSKGNTMRQQIYNRNLELVRSRSTEKVLKSNRYLSNKRCGWSNTRLNWSYFLSRTLKLHIPFPQ